MMLSPQNQKLTELKGILSQEIQSYEALEKMMTHKKALLIAGKAEELSRLDQDLLRITQKVTELEQKRMTLLVQMGHQNQTLHEFIRTLDIQDSRNFMEARQRLVRVVDNVKTLNETNRTLLDLSLKWIESSVEVIASLLVPEGASYTQKGGKPQGKQQGTVTTMISSTIEHSA